MYVGSGIKTHGIGINKTSNKGLYTIFINNRLAILTNLKCLQLKRELNNKKDCVKMIRYVLF